MRVCFLRTDPGPVELAAALEQAGDVEVVVAERPPEGRWDVAIACDWRACAAVFDVDAARYAALLVALEHRSLDPARPERMPALLALDLPLDYLVTSAWLERALADVRPGARAWRVALARPVAAREPAAADGSLRVAGAGEELLEAMREGAVEVALDDEPHVVVALPAADHPHRLPLSPLAPLLAGFAAGATAVAADLEGRDEVVVADENGLLIEPDDVAGAARALDRLAVDRELLERLRAGAARTAQEWPGADSAGRELRATLERILDADPPPGAAPGELMRHALAQAAELAAYESARHDNLLARSQELDRRESALLKWAATPAFKVLEALRRRARPLRAALRRVRGS